MAMSAISSAACGFVGGAMVRWVEFDLEGKVWTVPPARTKSAREHRVPLSDRALAILRDLEAGRTGDHVFPGRRPGRPLSGMAFEMLLPRIKSPYTGSRLPKLIPRLATKPISRANSPNTL